jgi:outer membrane lipoprotein-sorting protein
VSAGAEPVVTKNFIARDGELRRDESETLARPYALLVTAEGKFLLFPDLKLFASVANKQLGEETLPGEQDSDTSPDRLLHTELLTMSYESLGAETVDGRETQKYRVTANSSQAESVNNGETLLWFDETLHMPVKTETKSPDGTRVTTELVDVVLKVDPSLFEIPKDYQQIEFKKARERLRPNQP